MVSPEELGEALLIRRRRLVGPVCGGFHHLARYGSGTVPWVTPKSGCGGEAGPAV
jgi:hypothetical protein